MRLSKRWDEMTARELDTPTKQCAYCGDTFSKPPRQGQSDWKRRKYCSLLCANQHKADERKNRVTVTCGQCGKNFEARKNYVDRGQMKYCSVECSSIASRKHDVREFNGVRYYFSPIHGYFRSEEGRNMHRDVWSYYNGDPPSGYVIHHIDGDKTNNDISNLKLMEWGEHTRHHHKTGVQFGTITCKGCGKTVLRRQSEINNGQDKFCSRECSNRFRRRDDGGRFSSGHDIAALRACEVDV